MRMEKIQHWLHKWCWSTKTLYLSLSLSLSLLFILNSFLFLLSSKHTHTQTHTLSFLLSYYSFSYYWYIHIHFFSLFFMLTSCASLTHLLSFFLSFTIWWSVWSGLLTSRPMLTSPTLKIKQGFWIKACALLVLGLIILVGHLSVTSIWPDWSVRATEFLRPGWLIPEVNLTTHLDPLRWH